ncbi:MAG: UDP-glucose/GDP-mannose dehydrogenase family protein [Oligoflexales bacterium]
MKIGVVGTGYVGLVTGACLSDVGHEVWCIDSNKAKVDGLKKSISPIFEPGIESIIENNTNAERLFFSTEIKDISADCDVIFIAVGTPQSDSGECDLTAVLAVANQIAQSLKNKPLMILKSTVPVGTCARVEKLMNETLASRGVDFRLQVASNPEFLKEGKAIDDFMRPDRIIVGLRDKDEAAIKTIKQIYKTFIIDDPSRLLIMKTESSELTKYASNVMLASRISFMNELSRLCDVAGADIDSVRLGIGSDTRIGKKFLYAGPGYGGSCFPKDVSALIHIGKEHKVDFNLPSSIKQANESQKKYVTDKVLKALGGNVSGKKVTIWGLAFKPGTDDIRDAPSIDIVTALLERGAKINAHDPQAKENFQDLIKGEIRYFDDLWESVEGSDAVVLITEWSEYKSPDWKKIYPAMRTPTIVDLRNQYDRPLIESCGFKYECVGRPAHSQFY